MKLAALALVACSATACTSPERAVDFKVGTWERYDDQGRVIDRLTLDRKGHFDSSVTYYWPTWPSLDGDYSTTSGTYEVVADRLLLHGTTVDGLTYELRTTFYADDASFVLAPFVPEPGTQHYQAVYMRSTEGVPVFGWDLRASLWMDASSYLIGYTDPIWKTEKAEGGSFTTAPDGSMVLEQGVTFVSFGDGQAFGADDAFERGLDYDPLPLAAGLIYQRVQPVL